MPRNLTRRLFSVALIGLFSAGGGRLPVIDGLLFHSRSQATRGTRPHYEPSTGCHADGCALRSTPSVVHSTPAVGQSGLVILPSSPALAYWCCS